MRARGYAMGAALVVVGAAGSAAAWWPHSFLNQLVAAPTVSATTVPANGDLNPYGVAVVSVERGKLHRGHVLVSNFNDASNQQGAGSTIVDVDLHAPVVNPPAAVFFQGAPGLGLTTALAVLRAGVVVVGAAPFDASTGTLDDGALLFIDANGNLLATLSDSQLVRGPWDLAVDERDPDRPLLFVSDVLDGTVVRIRLHVGAAVSVESITRIGSGFLIRPDPNALVVGPTGLAWDADDDTLFVADTGNNRIARLEHASRVDFDEGHGRTVFAGAPLQGPLGLILVPGLEHLVAVNGDAVPSGTALNTAVELTESGALVATRQLDASGTPGALFGVAFDVVGGEPSLVYVDDNTNTLNLLPTK